MPLGDTDIGTGSLVTFGTSTYSAQVLNIDWSGFSREAIDISYMKQTTDTATATGHMFKPGRIYDPGEITVEYNFNSTLNPLITATPESVTISFPAISGTADTWVATAFVTGFEIHDPLEDKMTSRMTLKVTGTPNFTP